MGIWMLYRVTSFPTNLSINQNTHRNKMKHKEHKDRKSFAKWGMPNQRVMTQTKAKKIIRRSKLRHIAISTELLAQG